MKKLVFYIKPKTEEMTYSYLLEAINDRYTLNGNCKESTFNLYWIGKTGRLPIITISNTTDSNKISDGDKDEVTISSDKDIETFLDKCKRSQLQLFMKYLIEEPTRPPYVPPDIRKQIADLTLRVQNIESVMSAQTVAINNLKRHIHSPPIPRQVPREDPIIQSAVGDWVLIDFQEECLGHNIQTRRTNNLAIQFVVPKAPSMPYVKPSNSRKRLKARQESQEQDDSDCPPKDHWLNRTIESIQFPCYLRKKSRLNRDKSINNEPQSKTPANNIVGGSNTL